MSAMIKDISGLVFGKVTVLSYAGNNKHGAAVWNCSCSCGRTKEIVGFHLRNGRTRSCGCLVKETSSRVNLHHGHTANMGGHKSPTYRTWRSMINRCYREQEDSYRYYGGKGITVCSKWRESFSAFLEDMGERPDGRTIDRIRSEENYEPGNCRWSDAKTQASNKGMQKNNTSGYKNVIWRKNRWLVLLQVAGEKKYFGSFTDIDLAAKAAEEARRSIA